MKGTGWIKFKYKLPYSAVKGRTPPYDFPVLIAIEVDGKISYEVVNAKKISEIYTNDVELQDHIQAWQAIEPLI